jgi:hypothetical protein
MPGASAFDISSDETGKEFGLTEVASFLQLKKRAGRKNSEATIALEVEIFILVLI